MRYFENLGLGTQPRLISELFSYSPLMVSSITGLAEFFSPRVEFQLTLIPGVVDATMKARQMFF